MAEQITLEEALELVTFRRNCDGDWFVRHVHGDVDGNVEGNVSVVGGNVWNYVGGSVWGTISHRRWRFVETRQEKKLQRLIEETGNQELIDAFNQLEDN